MHSTVVNDRERFKSQLPRDPGAALNELIMSFNRALRRILYFLIANCVLSLIAIYLCYKILIQ
jgi:hypothetical protein